MSQRAVKRGLDLLVAVVGLVGLSWLIAIAVIGATVSTREWGLFSQSRIGREGRPFRLVKVKTMRTDRTYVSTVTTAHDARVTPFGRILRRTKIDELPQLWNVVRGEMSLVGPRPDVSGFADLLADDDRILLTLRPGVTGPATLVFRHEERLLAVQPDPEAFNANVLYPAKVKLNRHYIEHYSFGRDLAYLLLTLPIPGALRAPVERRIDLKPDTWWIASAAL